MSDFVGVYCGRGHLLATVSAADGFWVVRQCQSCKDHTCTWLGDQRCLGCHPPPPPSGLVESPRMPTMDGIDHRGPRTWKDDLPPTRDERAFLRALAMERILNTERTAAEYRVAQRRANEIACRMIPESER